MSTSYAMGIRRRTLTAGLAGCILVGGLILGWLAWYGERLQSAELACYGPRAGPQVEGRAEDPESEASGMLVVSVLERFRTDSGTYPKRLSELVPRYLERIPRPRGVEGTWHYVPDRGLQSFQLMYGIDPQYEEAGDLPLPRRTWDSVSKEWGFSQ